MTSTFHAPVSLRDGDSDSPGRLVGVLMRYGSPGLHGSEKFAVGSLSWPVNGIRIDLDHASSPARGSVQPPLMRAVPVVSDDGREVMIDAALPNTQAARDLAVLMRSDPPMYSGLSVEFRPVKQRSEGNVRVVESATLEGCALTDRPAYGDTSVSVRDRRSRRVRLWR